MSSHDNPNEPEELPVKVEVLFHKTRNTHEFLVTIGGKRHYFDTEKEVRDFLTKKDELYEVRYNEH